MTKFYTSDIPTLEKIKQAAIDATKWIEHTRSKEYVCAEIVHMMDESWWYRFNSIGVYDTIHWASYPTELKYDIMWEVITAPFDLYNKLSWENTGLYNESRLYHDAQDIVIVIGHFMFGEFTESGNYIDITADLLTKLLVAQDNWLCLEKDRQESIVKASESTQD